jgi:hypothetical protein
MSAAVDVNTVQQLHTGGLQAGVPQDVRDLMDAVAAERLAAVHPMSPAEIAADAYGFAREFTIALRAGASLDSAISILRQSPLIKSARAVVVRQASSGDSDQ